MTDIEKLLELLKNSTSPMTQAEIDAQRESYVKAEMSWPKAKFTWIDGVKVYHSYEDYGND